MNFEALFAGLPTAFLVMDRDLVIREANAAYEQLLGRSREELVGRPLFDAFPPSPDALDEQGRNPLQTSFEQARDTGEPVVMPLHRYAVEDPETGEMVERFWSLVSAPVLGEDGATELIVQRVEDVTDYVRERQAHRPGSDGDEAWANRVEAVEIELFVRMKQLQSAKEAQLAAVEALRASEQHARAILDAAVDGIITIDGTGCVKSMNAAAEEMFGYAEEEVVGRNVSMLMPEPYRSEHDGYLERYHRTGERRIIGTGREVAGQRRDGSVFPVELAVSEVGTDRNMFTGVVRDITDRKRLENELVQQALYDPLTGLANRRLMMERLELALTRRERHPGALALLFIDLDRFKLVNDTLGHDAGDELLTQTAERLRGVVRSEDLVARLGGDEFVILCDDLSGTADAEILARRVVEQLNVPFELRGREIYVSASVGVVTDIGRRTAVELLTDADVAMYQAKDQGRARYSMLDDAARARSSDQLQLGSDLHRALERGELGRRYQPVVDLSTGDVTAVEALMRWQHPTRGELSPGDFLGLAIERGLINDLDSWMAAAGCVDAAEWGRDLGRPISVWVNISGRTLADRRLPRVLADVLEQSRLNPELLTLEISEGELMQDAPATVAALNRLKELGVQLAIDDFGTGYSSLAYLEQFPVHALKVDRSFVGRLDQAPNEAEASAAIVRAVVNLAVALGLRTIAEGVETPGQLAAVTDLGCDLGQGYFLGRPAPQHRVATAMRTGITLPGTEMTAAG